MHRCWTWLIISAILCNKMRMGHRETMSKPSRRLIVVHHRQLPVQSTSRPHLHPARSGQVLLELVGCRCQLLAVSPHQLLLPGPAGHSWVLPRVRVHTLSLWG